MLLSTVERTRPKACWNVERIVEDMALRGWNATDVADRARVAPKTINRFISGEVQTAKTAKLIARALGFKVRRYLSHVKAAA